MPAERVIHHEPPGIAATPMPRRPAIWLGVGAVVLATLASLGLAGIARPMAALPDVPAAHYLAPTGQRSMLHGEDGSKVIETSHLPGGQGWAEQSETAWTSTMGLEADDLQNAHWVTETDITAEQTSHTFYQLGPEGLRIFSGGNADFEFAALPAIIELPPDPKPGMTWTQESTLHVPALGITLPMTRSASIAASPQGGGCLDFTYDDMVGDEPGLVEITRCPGRGIVAWDGASASTDPLSWATKAMDLAPAPLNFTALTPLNADLKNGALDLVPTIAGPPVALGNGFVYSNQFTNHLVFMQPRSAGGADMGMQLTWIRRPGPTTLALLGAGDLVVAATSDRQLVAYDIDGLVRWQVTTADIAGLPPILLDQNTLVVPTLDGFLSAHDLRTGAQKWRTAAPAGEVPLSIVHVDGRPMTVVLAGPDLHLYDADQHHLSVTMLDTVTSVAQTSAGLVVADAGGLVTLVDLTGRAHWSRWTDGCTEVTAIGESVYCPEKNTLLALSSANGAEIFTRELRAQTLATDGSLLAALTDDGITVLNAGGGVHAELPMAAREGVSFWLFQGRQNLFVATNLNEIFRWGMP